MQLIFLVALRCIASSEQKPGFHPSGEKHAYRGPPCLLEQLRAGLRRKEFVSIPDLIAAINGRSSTVALTLERENVIEGQLNLCVKMCFVNGSVNFRQHLTKQLGFLERSCKSYDEGHIDEAIRIATVIRVLVHDTKSCTSLLKHLGATNINLASTVANVDASHAVMFWGMGQFTMSSSDITYKPNLDANSIKTSLPANEWWNQIVYVHGSSLKLSRKTIVLGAADKDGGAHVDAKLTPEYAALAQSGAVGSLVYDHHTFHVTIPIENAHLGYIRQMGHEILNSSELRKLASV